MDSMGQQFKAARERKRMPLSQAAAQTRIKLQFIEQMEQDDYSRMPAPAYAKGFIRMYASFLGLDPVPLVQEYVDQHMGRKGPRNPATAPAAKQDRPRPAWLLKNRPLVPTPAPAPKPAPAPAPEPKQKPVAPIRPAEPESVFVERPEPVTPPPPKKVRPAFKWPDFKPLGRVLLAWPWSRIGSVAGVVLVLVLLVNGLARCVRKADSSSTVSRSVAFKKGVPSVIAEPSEPYLPVPTETAEKKP